VRLSPIASAVTRHEKVGFILKHLTELHRDRTFRVAVDMNKIVEALTPEESEYSGTFKPKTSLGISVFARTIERSAHGNLGGRANGNTPQLQGLLSIGPPSKPFGSRHGVCHGRC
jgi:hypothetical protein